MTTTVHRNDFRQFGPVQAGIPIAPKANGAKPSAVRLALEELEPGESRVFSGISTAKLVSTAATLRKVLGRRYSCRTVSDGIVRVWRLA